MAHTHTNLLYHIVFSTRGRAPMIDPPLAERLFPYMCGIIRELKGVAFEINGPENHVHILAKLPQTISVSDALRLIKTNSSGWVHDTWRERSTFAWQTGYAAFTVSESILDDVRGYIRNQQEHHKTVTFEQEFIAFLKKNKIPFDERFVWD